MTHEEYWQECIAQAAEEAGLKLTVEQECALAAAAQAAHENYGMAFYSPPPGDRIAEVEREWERKLDALQHEFNTYQGNAEKAVKQALRQRPDAQVLIGEYGEVTRHDGRTTQIQ